MPMIVRLRSSNRNGHRGAQPSPTEVYEKLNQPSLLGPAASEPESGNVQLEGSAQPATGSSNLDNLIRK